MTVGDQVQVSGRGYGIVTDISGDKVGVVLESGEYISTAAGMPFFTFVCDTELGGCGHAVELYQQVEPGQVAVLVCDNCGVSWCVYCPPLELHRTDKFERVWPMIGQ